MTMNFNIKNLSQLFLSYSILPFCAVLCGTLPANALPANEITLTNQTSNHIQYFEGGFAEKNTRSRKTRMMITQNGWPAEIAFSTNKAHIDETVSFEALNCADFPGELIWEVETGKEKKIFQGPGKHTIVFLTGGTKNFNLILRDPNGNEPDQVFNKTLEVTCLPVDYKEEVLTVCDGNTITLEAPINGKKYLWSNGETSKSVDVYLVGTYTVEMIDEEKGCVEIATFEVNANGCNEYLNIPNVITPNGDGHNDRLIVSHVNIASFQINIFDRTGTMVFSTSSLAENWDGKQNGAYVNPGSYFYQVKAVTNSGNNLGKSGNITVIR